MENEKYADQIILDAREKYAEWLEHSHDPERLLNTILACKIIELYSKIDWLKTDLEYEKSKRMNYVTRG